MLTFRRKHKIDPAELESVREQVTSLRDELQVAASEREALVRRVNQLERARADALHDLFQMPPPASLSPPPPGFSLHEVHGLALDAATSATEIRRRLDVLSIQVQASDDDARRARELAADVQLRLDSIAGELTNQIDELANEIELLGRQAPTLHITATPAPPPPPPPPPTLEELAALLDEDVDDLDEELVDALADDPAESEDVGEADESEDVGEADELDDLELDDLEQDDDLDDDLRPAGDISPNGHRVAVVDPAVIEELWAGQVRLANEQARYEIAFRADLASLADELRRRSG